MPGTGALPAARADVSPVVLHNLHLVVCYGLVLAGQLHAKMLCMTQLGVHTAYSLVCWGLPSVLVSDGGDLCHLPGSEAGGEFPGELAGPAPPVSRAMHSATCASLRSTLLNLMLVVTPCLQCRPDTGLLAHEGHEASHFLSPEKLI